MKKILTVLFSAVVLLSAGCRYEAPLTEEHVVPVDPKLLGLWEEMRDGDDDEKPNRMLVLKFSDTEYLIHYPMTGDEIMYWRAYPVKVGGVSCVQIQLLSSDDGRPAEGVTRLYQVMGYKIEDGVLGTVPMEEKLVDDDLGTSAEIKEAFLKNKDNKNLFPESDASFFKKVR